MLGNVLGEYLDSLDGREREFDAPFIALLRANGYTDIHFTHGQYEFGKDFLAKGKDRNGVLCQFVFQTKGGDVGLGNWHPIRGQIDQLRTNELAHPSFDATLPRRAVLVITGRLVGGAILEAQQYTQHLEKLNELGFILWDKEILTDMLLNSPHAGLAGASDAALLTLIGHAKGGQATREALERYSQRWRTSPDALNPLLRASIESGVIGNALRVSGRPDLACLISLCIIRAAWASTHGADPLNELGLIVSNSGKMLFEHYASEIWEHCSEETLDPQKFLINSDGLATFVTGSVRCFTLLEILGLFGFLLLDSGNVEASSAVATFVNGMFERLPASTHPASDKWAVSMISPTLLLYVFGYEARVERALREIARWTHDAYDDKGFGLARPHAEAIEEVNFLFGKPFECVPLQRRADSYISTVVLDLVSVFEMGALYEDIRNDVQAVDAYCPYVDTGDTLGQYVHHEEGTRHEYTQVYREKWMPTDNWKVAAHHERYALTDFYLPRNGKLWEHLILSSVLRDRHFPHTWRGILGSYKLEVQPAA